MILARIIGREAIWTIKTEKSALAGRRLSTECEADHG